MSNIQTPHLSVQSINAAKAEVSSYCSEQIREFTVQFYHAQLSRNRRMEFPGTKFDNLAIVQQKILVGLYTQGRLGSSCASSQSD